MKTLIAKIEGWFKRLISEVVSAERVTKADVQKLTTEALSGFRAELVRVHSEERVAFEKLHQDVVADFAKIVSEKNQVITDAHTKVAELQAALRKFTQWTADEETKAADKIHQEIKRL